MRKIYKAWHVYNRKGISGYWFIRDAYNFLDRRPSANNDGKGPIRLLMDFAEYTLEIERQFSK